MSRALAKKDAQFIKREIALRTNLKKRKKFRKKNIQARGEKEYELLTRR